MASIQKWRDHQATTMPPGDLLDPTRETTQEKVFPTPQPGTPAEGKMSRAHKLHSLSQFPKQFCSAISFASQSPIK